MNATLHSEPELAQAYDIFISCRAQNIVTYQESKGKDRSVQHIRPYTTGWAVLPSEGGLLDQPHRLMSFLEIFMTGDKNGFFLGMR